MQCHNCKSGMEEITYDVHWCDKCGAITCPIYGEQTCVASGQLKQKLLKEISDAKYEIRNLGPIVGLDPEKEL